MNNTKKQIIQHLKNKIEWTQEMCDNCPMDTEKERNTYNFDLGVLITTRAFLKVLENKRQLAKVRVI